MRRAFTLVEVLIVIGIVVILIALATPAYFSATERSYVETCASNFKQIHTALMLYQQDHNGVGVYGDLYEMGLPSDPAALRLPEFECRGAPNELISSPKAAYIWRMVPPETDNLPIKWKDYTQAAQENSLLLMDINHNSKEIPLMDHRFVHFALGLRLSGQVVRKRKAGDWRTWRWWDD